jgi:apolipoprotein D and lipocalin family protein
LAVLVIGTSSVILLYLSYNIFQNGRNLSRGKIESSRKLMTVFTDVQIMPFKPSCVEEAVLGGGATPPLEGTRETAGKGATMHIFPKQLVWLSFFALPFLFSGGCAWHSAESEKPPLQTVPFVDLTRYAGTWYEIARLPMWFQRDCVASQANYTPLLTGKIKVKNQCVTKSGDQKEAQGLATVVDSNTNAKLHVVFDNLLAKLFSGWGSASTIGNYWILHLAPDYQTAIIGTPDREYFWILSRTPTLDQATYEQLVSLGKAMGFPTANLIRDSHP